MVYTKFYIYDFIVFLESWLYFKLELLGQYFDLGEILSADTAVYKPKIVDDPTSVHKIKPSFLTGQNENSLISYIRLCQFRKFSRARDSFRTKTENILLFTEKIFKKGQDFLNMPKSLHPKCQRGEIFVKNFCSQDRRSS